MNPIQRAPHRRGGLLDQLDDLELLGGGVPHAASSPSAVTFFLSRRFSRVSSTSIVPSLGGSSRKSHEVPMAGAEPGTLVPGGGRATSGTRAGPVGSTQRMSPTATAHVVSP